MFDIGFFEIVFIFIVTLLVVGPEKLPRVARTAGLWLGKLRGFVSSVKADIDREIAADELKKTLERQAAVPELEELIDEVSGKPLEAGERKATADTE
ncbi:MAG TPA: Sec-independent protein translocase protein TatB, partial [Gammaproteobacteria bacterium]|nr:Sec-independent protein translocase protein TatB [Gammaproteobacteria bacterium]